MPVADHTLSESGFYVVPGALSAAELSALNAAIDVDDAASPAEWMIREDGHVRQSVTLLLRQRVFDPLLTAPALLNPVREIFGDETLLDEFSAMRRAPLATPAPPPGWHRDFALAPELPLGAPALSVVYYLTDVGPGDHCFSIVPRSHLDASIPANDDTAFDIRGPAGTALVFHPSCLHAGRLRQGASERRTVHIYYSRADRPPVSAHSHLPARLAADPIADTPPHFYRLCVK